MTALDLAVYLGALYGASWVVARSLVARSLRVRVERWPGLGAMVKCIVCVSWWVGLGLSWAVVPRCPLFSRAFREGAPTLAGSSVLGACGLAVVWLVAVRVGDAD